MAFWTVKIFLSVCKKNDKKYEIGIFIAKRKSLKKVLVIEALSFKETKFIKIQKARSLNTSGF